MLEDPYRRSASQVLHALHVVADRGLNLETVKRRRAQLGSNDLPRGKSRHPLWLFLDRFRDVLVLVLLGAALISLLLGRWADVIIILTALLLDASLSFAQVWRTDHTLKKIREYVQPHASVFREGALKKIPARDLVVGDIVEIRAGEGVPADARLIRVRGLRVREGSLTGESDDVEKATIRFEKRVPVSSRRNMVYMGTSVVNGSGTAVVVAVGTRTEIGKIAQVLKTEVSPPSPLRRKLQRTGIQIGSAVIAAVLLLFAIGVALGQDLLTTALTATTLVVSAIPEDLTMILTIALTVGVTRILKKKGVVKDLSSGETLGAATVICIDKTGTLTRGVMEAKTLDFLQGDVLTREESFGKSDSQSPLHRLALAGLALASDAHRVANDDGSITYVGTATERAALAFVEEKGLIQEDLRHQWPQRGAISFSGQWKYRATLHDHPTQATAYLFAVGAPEVLLERSSRVLNAHNEAVDMTSARRFELGQKLESLAAAGNRMVAVVVRRNVSLNEIRHDDVSDLLFLGVLTIHDPIREQVPDAVRATLAAGIDIKLVTGDHPGTARAVGRAVGLTAREVVTSEELEHMSDSELADVIERVTIFARITPLDKQRIVRALQKHGHIVAMTGDGVNDAVALKAADIGVAMGSGKDIAKQAADLVLLDDSFSTIVAAIREGRVLRDNVRKVIAFLLSTNGAEIAIFFASLMAGLPLPLLPAQILWINLVTDGTSDIALSLEPAERGVMKHRPESPKEQLINANIVAHIIFVGFGMTCGVMGLYWYLFHYLGSDLTYVRTMIFTLVSLASLLSVWSFRSLKETIFRRGLLGNPWVPVSLAVSLVLHMLAVYLPFLQKFFHTVPLSPRDWMLLTAVAVATLAVAELRKLFVFKLWPPKRVESVHTERASLANT